MGQTVLTTLLGTSTKDNCVEITTEWHKITWITERLCVLTKDILSPCPFSSRAASQVVIILHIRMKLEIKRISPLNFSVYSSFTHPHSSVGLDVLQINKWASISCELASSKLWIVGEWCTHRDTEKNSANEGLHIWLNPVENICEWSCRLRLCN